MHENCTDRKILLTTISQDEVNLTKSSWRSFSSVYMCINHGSILVTVFAFDGPTVRNELPDDVYSASSASFSRKKLKYNFCLAKP